MVNKYKSTITFAGSTEKVIIEKDDRKSLDSNIAIYTNKAKSQGYQSKVTIYLYGIIIEQFKI